MTDNLLDKLTKPATKVGETSGSSGATSDQVEVDDFGTFSFLRGVRDRAFFLELRKKNGLVKAIGYAWIWEMELDPSGEIRLFYHGSKIRIIGRNLNTEVRPNMRMFQGICRHRVTFIQEADQSSLMRADVRETVIEMIEW